MQKYITNIVNFVLLSLKSCFFKEMNLPFYGIFMIYKFHLELLMFFIKLRFLEDFCEVESVKIGLFGAQFTISPFY